VLIKGKSGRRGINTMTLSKDRSAGRILWWAPRDEKKDGALAEYGPSQTRTETGSKRETVSQEKTKERHRCT